jgi:hypothetical protein
MPTSLLSVPGEFGPQVPVQLIQILTKINENVAEVKERVIRLEAQDYQHAVRELRTALEVEVGKRQRLEEKFSEFKNKLTPIFAGASIAFTIGANYLIRTMHI